MLKYSGSGHKSISISQKTTSLHTSRTYSFDRNALLSTNLNIFLVPRMRLGLLLSLPQQGFTEALLKRESAPPKKTTTGYPPPPKKKCSCRSHSNFPPPPITKFPHSKHIIRQETRSLSSLLKPFACANTKWPNKFKIQEINKSPLFDLSFPY